MMPNTLLIVLFALVLLVCSTVVLITKMMIDKDIKNRAIENGNTVKSLVVPLRLQAYERMALFLERIDLNQLVMRIHKAGLTAAQEQNLMLTAIRTEFEHNLSQQIYISDVVWEAVRNAKEDIITIIHTVVLEVGPDTDSMALAEALLHKAAENPIVDKALQILKADIRKLF